MPEPTTTSGATPAVTSVTPPAPAATTTPSEPQAGDEPISLEEAKKLRQEANALRKREKDVLAQLKVYQDAEQAKANAELPELERHKKLVAEQQEQIESLATQVLMSNVRQEVADQVGKFNFVVSARFIADHLLKDFDAITFDEETDMPTNIKELLDKLAKAEPKLVEQKAESQQQQQGVPNMPAWNPGRSSITPGGSVPGRVPNLFDPNLWKK